MKLFENKKLLIVLIAGAIISGIGVVLLLFSGPRMKSQPSLKAFNQAVNLPPENSVLFSPGNSGMEEIAVASISEENMHRGEIYYEYYCAFCHGQNGQGNGPVGQSYNPKPADLTKSDFLQLGQEELYNLTFKGIGHQPVLNKVVATDHRSYLLLFIRESFGK